MAPETAREEGRFYYQLVIRIFKGRMFPASVGDDGGRHIALEARFNGESLSTDPVSLCPEPTYNTELVWEFGASKLREIREREGSTLRLQCVLAGEDTAHAGAKQVGFVMLDLRPFAASATGSLSAISTVSGRSGSGGLTTAKSEARWYQLRGARRPLPEIKIFVKINCKPIVSLVSGPPAAEDQGGGHPRSPPKKSILARAAQAAGRTRSLTEQKAVMQKHGVGLHGTVFLPPQRLPPGTRRESGMWGKFTLVVRCKSVVQDQVGVRSTVPLEGSWSLLVGIAGRMYAIHAAHVASSNIAPEYPGDTGTVHEVFIAEASSLADFLERSDGRGGGIALFLFQGGLQIASGTVSLGQLAGSLGRMWREGQIGSMATSTKLLGTWVPSRMDDGGSGVAGDFVPNASQVASVDLDIDLFGSGSGPELPVPVPDAPQLVPCSLAITLISVCLTHGPPLGVRNLTLKCHRSSMHRVGLAETTLLHTSQPVSLVTDGSEGAEGKYLGVGEMFSMAGAWGDMSEVKLEFDLADSDEERLLGAGMIDVGTVVCENHSTDDVTGVAGAMRVRTLALVDQAGRALGRLSLMVSCNLSLDFPAGTPEDPDCEGTRGQMLHEAQRVALVCEAAPEGLLEVSRRMAVSIDLQSIRSLTNNPESIYLRYSVPTLGYLPPILTAPLYTERHGAVSLNSYNLYDVVLSYRSLAAALATPIRLEVWSKEKYAKDRLIAIADVHLWFLFADLPGDGKTPARRRHIQEQRAWAGVVSAYEVDEESARSAEKLGTGAVEVMTTTRKLFAVSVSLAFDDKGAVDGVEGGQKPLQPGPSASEGADSFPPPYLTQPIKPEELVRQSALSLVTGSPSPPSDVNDVETAVLCPTSTSALSRGASAQRARQTAPARSAGDNEDQGEAGPSLTLSQSFASEPRSGGGGSGAGRSTQLREREEALLASLEAEFRRQEEVRERAATRKMAELTKLEAALKSSLNEVERRERRLALAEEEAAGKRRQEASMLEQRRAELQEARKRMREEAAHDVSMAEARRNEALQQLQDEKARMKESEERNTRLDSELHKLKSTQRNTSEPSLMVEVAALKAKNEELMERLQRSEEQHVICKEQLAKALTRLSRIREEEHQREVESMKLLLQAREEEQEIREERLQLDDLRRQIQELKERGVKRGGARGAVKGEMRVGSARSTTARSNALAFAKIPEDEESEEGGEDPGEGAGEEASAGALRSLAVEAVQTEGAVESEDEGEHSPSALRTKVGRFGGDTPEKRQATTEKEEQMLAQLTEEHLRLRDERDALLRTGIYSPDDDVIVEIQRHMWQVSREISAIGVPLSDL